MVPIYDKLASVDFYDQTSGERPIFAKSFEIIFGLLICVPMLKTFSGLKTTNKHTLTRAQLYKINDVVS